MTAPGRGSDISNPAELSAVVVHWHDREALTRLVAAWPEDPRFELVVVDNGGFDEPLAAPTRWVSPGTNLGFGGGVNAGVRAASAPVLLILNPDAEPLPGALEALLDAFRARPETAGFAPRLEEEDGRSQHEWQLASLPSAADLVLSNLGRVPRLGPTDEPPTGSRVEQPAAAALALRREALEAVGGFDEGFFPAWFEDVDLARRLGARGSVLRYWPTARFRHQGGSTVPTLGYGRFLWIYSRNLERYLTKHHGRLAAFVARAALLLSLPLRFGAVLVRRPRRARSRADALAGLFRLKLGVLSGWRTPEAWARPPESREEPAE